MAIEGSDCTSTVMFGHIEEPWELAEPMTSWQLDFKDVSSVAIRLQPLVDRMLAKEVHCRLPDADAVLGLIGQGGECEFE